MTLRPVARQRTHDCLRETRAYQPYKDAALLEMKARTTPVETAGPGAGGHGQPTAR
jgi:hypothetical protein